MENSKNTQTMEIEMQLTFKKDIDMTEFNEKTLKAGEITAAEEEYLQNKIDELGINSITQELIEKLKGMEAECISAKVFAHKPTLAYTMARKLTSDLMGIK